MLYKDLNNNIHAAGCVEITQAEADAMSYSATSSAGTLSFWKEIH